MWLRAKEANAAQGVKARRRRSADQPHASVTPREHIAISAIEMSKASLSDSSKLYGSGWRSAKRWRRPYRMGIWSA
jgi:hypothetical protein